jgi:Peptidyl-prolyl cis-trans isomerase (rotamase) - cyclophilin family
MRFKTLKASLFTGLLAASAAAQATIVKFETSLGDIEVNLFDEYTPETVENFLAYVESGAYDNTFIHRSAKGFVVQGGGFAYDPNYTALNQVALTPHIEELPAVVNEPVLSNQRGTISMAKRGGDPNSATSEWFFNVSDNSANLDNQNGGFTAFGQVTEEGMAIVDQINKLSVINLGAQTAFGALPLRNYTDLDYIAREPITDSNRVMILSVTVVDPAPDTAADLEPVLAIKQDPPPAKKKKSGAPGSEYLLLLGALALLRRKYQK